MRLMTCSCVVVVVDVDDEVRTSVLLLLAPGCCVTPSVGWGVTHAWAVAMMHTHKTAKDTLVRAMVDSRLAGGTGQDDDDR